MRSIILMLLITALITGYFVFQKTDSSLLTQFQQLTSNKVNPGQAVEKVKNLPEVDNFLINVANGMVEIDNESEEIYNIHVYEIRDRHTATFNWYTVDKKTGELKKEF